MIQLDLGRYATMMFDCDGVILDSNRIKTEAFFAVALPYGKSVADALVAHHKEHGGISRYRKFEYFLDNIVGGPREQSALHCLLEAYAREVRQGLLTCRVNPGLEPLRLATSGARWLVVSGGDQNELRDVFSKRNLAHMFEGGIFGSPDTKDIILAREKSNANIRLPALFIGDSRYDHEAAVRAGLDFVFLSEWSEFYDWKAYQKSASFVAVPTIRKRSFPSTK